MDPRENEVLDAVIEEQAARRAEGRCWRCDETDARPVSFMRVMSFVFFTSHTKYDSFLCPGCIAKTGAKEQAISCALGWWGIPWGLLTIGAIFINLRSLFRGNMVGAFAGLGIPAALVLAVLALPLSDLGSRSSSDDSGEYVSAEASSLFEKASRKMQEGDLHGARADLLEAHRLEPESWIIAYELGGVCLGLGQTKDALRYARQALTSQPRELDCIALVIHAAESDGNLEIACQARKMLLSVQDTTENHLGYQALSRMRGPEGLQEARAFYAERLERAPQSGLARFLHARLLDDPEERLEELKKADRDQPRETAIRLELAFAHLALRQVDAATAAASGVDPTLQPDPFRGAIGAELALARGDAEAALKIVDRSEQREGSRGAPALLNQRYMALMDLERHQELIRLLDGALVNAPPDSNLLLLKLRALGNSGAHEQALAFSSKVEASLGSQHHLFRGALDRERIAIHWNAGELQKALAITEAERTRSLPGVRLWRALLLLLSDRDREGMDLMRSLSEIPITDAESAVDRAVARLFIGDMDEDAYRQFASLQPASFDNNVWFHLGLKRERAGQPKKALEAYRKSIACSQGRNFPIVQAERAVKRLAR